MSAIHAEVSQPRPMIWPSSRFEAPSASSDRTNRGLLSVVSLASFANCQARTWTYGHQDGEAVEYSFHAE